MTRANSSVLNGPVIVMFIGVVAFSIFEAGSLPEIATFFRPVHAATRAPEAAPSTLSIWLPISLVLVSSILLTSFAVAALLRRRRMSSAAAQETIPTPAHAVQHGLRIKAAAAPSRAAASAPKPFLIPREEARHTAMESFRLRRDEKVSAAARAAAAERLLTIVPSRSGSLFDSTPTLPVHPQVRRRDPRLGLPPALAAALQKQVAAGPLRRPNSASVAGSEPAVAS